MVVDERILVFHCGCKALPNKKGKGWFFHQFCPMHWPVVQKNYSRRDYRRPRR